MMELVKAIFSKDSGDAEILSILGSRKFLTQSLILLAVLYFAFLWTYPLTDRDEGFHVGTAAEMLRKGDWIVPTINDEIFFHKPVLIYWLTMPSLIVFGHNEFAARLPSAICMFLLVVVFRRLLKRITGDDVFSNASALVMAFSPIYLIVARTALTDGPLLLSVTVGLLSFFIAMEENRGPDLKWYLLFWLCLASGFLAKGPVAPAVMGPPIIVYCLCQKKIMHVLRRSMIPLGIVIFVAVNFWYLVMIHRLGDAYIEGFFVDQIFRRGTKVLVGRGGGLLYYVGVFILGGIPFSAVFLPSFWMSLKTGRWTRDSDPLGRLCFFASLSAIFTYLVFSSAATKLPHYVLPAFPWLSILAVCFFHRLHRGETPKRWVMATMRFLMIALPAIATVAVLLFPLAVPPALNFALKVMEPDSGEYALPMNTPIASYFVFPVALLTLYLTVYPLKILKAGMPYKALSSLLLGAVALCLAGIIYGSIAVNVLALEGKRMFVDVGKSASSEAKLAAYGLWKQSMSFYTQRKLVRYRYEYDTDLEALWEALKKPVPVYVMTRTRILDKLEACDSFVPIRQYDGYFLGGNAAAKAEFDAMEKR